MTFDPNTAYLVASFVLIVVGIERLVAWSTGRSEPWMLHWGTGTLLGGLGLAGVEFIGAVPDYIAISLSNVTVLIGHMLLLQAMRLFAGRPARWRPWLVIAATASAPLLLSWDPATFPWRIAYNNVVRAATTAWIMTEAARLARRERLFTAWTMATLFGLLVPVLLGRAMLAATGGLAAGPLAVGTGVSALLVVIASTLFALQASTLTAVAAERTEHALAALARTDPLTGALNRAGLADWRRGMRGRFALALIDLDRFKALNDRAGHAAGDAALRALGQAACALLATDERLVRLGGDEFLVVMPGRTATEATRRVAALRAGFAAGAIGIGGSGAPTFSVGIAAGDGSGVAFDALMQEADVALYAAKQAGRDRIHVARLAA